MTSQILFRVPIELKKKFKQITKEQGVSMDYVIHLFYPSLYTGSKYNEGGYGYGEIRRNN